MEPVNVNLATLEYVDKPFTYFLMGICVLLGSIFFIVNIYTTDTLSREADQYKSRIKQLKQTVSDQIAARQAQKMEVEEEEIERTRQNTDFVNFLIAQDIFPWDRVLGIFENKLPDKMFLESLLPELQTGKIMLKGYAASMNDVTQYLKDREGAEFLKKNRAGERSGKS